MRKNLNRTMSAALLTGGLLVATAGFAQAIPVPINVDEEVRVGNLVSVPVKVCGNAINVLGNSDATCEEKPAARTNADKALVSAPVTVCGNSAGVVGGGEGSCGPGGAAPDPNGTIEAPVTVCGTSAAVLGTASGDCGKTEVPEEPPVEEPPTEEPPVEEPPTEEPGGENPGGGNNNGGNTGGGNNTGGNAGSGDTGTGQQASSSSQQASPVKPLPRTGADPLEFLLAGATLLAAGAMARRGARRVTKA